MKQFHIAFLLMLALLPVSCSRSLPGMKVLETEQREGYTCMLVEYPVNDGERVQSYLLVPDGASRKDPRPGLVLLHDHGARFDIGKEKLVRPLPSAPEYTRRSAEQWSSNFDGVFFGDRLAAEGYVVIVPDQRYWGSRSTELTQQYARMQFAGEPGDMRAVKDAVYEGQRAVYDSLARLGIVWAEQTMQEDSTAAALLAGLDCVDAERIGAFGWSMGAHRSWMLTGFCPLVKTGVALCWMTLKETVALPLKASDYSMYIPRLRDNYDFPDIARKLAPKPYLFLAGTQDKLFPVWSVEAAYAQMQDIYSAAGASGAMQTEFFEGPHHCGLEVQDRIIEFFQTTLK